MAGDVTALKMPQLLGFSRLSQSSLRWELGQLHQEVESLSMLLPKREGEKKNGRGGKNLREDMFRKGMDHQHGSRILIVNFC